MSGLLRSMRCVPLLLAATAAAASAQGPEEPPEQGGDPSATRARLDAVERELEELRAVLANGAAARPSFTFYGCIKLDAAYDQSRVSIGNFARWVESDIIQPRDDQFSMTANQTRLGVKADLPPERGLAVRGQVEIDFYGAAPAENKPEPVLRHAFLAVDGRNSGWSLLAGQTWDVISPLCMPTVNYTVGWWQGNVGYRRPQLRVSKRFELSESWSLQLETAAARTISGRQADFTRAGGDTGQDAGFPTVQERISLRFPGPGDAAATIGLSGHWGEEEHDRTPQGPGEDHATWSLNLDLELPLTEDLVLLGEAFTGRNLDAYLGGAGQGFDPSLQQPIDAHGAWLAGRVRLGDHWKANAGWAFDDPSDADLSSAQSRSFNRVYFANAHYALTSATSVALEISHLYTGYRSQPSGKSWRGQLMFLLLF